MEKPQRQTAFLPCPSPDLVAGTAQSFQAVAKSQGKTFSLRIQPTLTLVGGGEEPGTAGVHPAGQRPEVFPAGGRLQ